MEIYEIIFWAYLALATITLIPTIKNILIGVKLNPSGASFDDCEHFNEKNRKRLEDHYSRLEGTLGFWKKRAESYTSFHYYSVIWTILSAWAVPIIASLSPESKGLKVSDGMKAFRHGESEFYDLYRRLLDRPHTLGKDENEQIDNYFLKVESIRKLIRISETDSLPSVEDVNETTKNG